MYGNLTSIFVEQTFGASMAAVRDCRAFGGTATCLELHNVHFIESVVCEDCRRVVCRFLAPDAESVRLALRSAGVEGRVLLNADSTWFCNHPVMRVEQ